jgi:uncharacterized repeat protein (TIGR01451 family)
MAPGASVTYNCSLASVKSSFTNVATASGTPPSGPNVTASDSAPVTVTVTRVIVPPPPSHPAIAIVKDPKSQSTILGGTATFKITVTNTGDVTLTSVAVDDPLSPQCDRDLGTLVAGQSKTYSCTRTNLKRDFRNVATVTGTPPSGAKVTAGDHADVTMSFTPPKPKHPRIAIVKSPKSQTVTTKVKNGRSTTGATTTTIEYGSARFTIRVKNNGQVTLHGVVVTDPQSTGCERQLGTLPPGASRSYRCARNVVSSGFTNVASVTGTSPKGQKVHDSDHALVKVAVRTATSGGSSAGAKKRSSAPFAPPKAPATSPFTPPKTSASGAPSFTG